MKNEVIAKKRIDEILESMIDLMGEGGMDCSYSGHYYKRAKKEAIKKIIALINSK